MVFALDLDLDLDHRSALAPSILTLTNFNCLRDISLPNSRSRTRTCPAYHVTHVPTALIAHSYLSAYHVTQVLNAFKSHLIAHSYLPAYHVTQVRTAFDCALVPTRIPWYSGYSRIRFPVYLTPCIRRDSFACSVLKPQKKKKKPSVFSLSLVG